MKEWSLLSQERGLKLLNDGAHVATNLVAPLAGAWIEITVTLYQQHGNPVAPLAGAWIEIMQSMTEHDSTSSLLSQERGLKYR